MCAACNGSAEQAGKGQLSDGACRPSSPLHPAPGAQALAHTISTGNTAQLLKNVLSTPAFTSPTRGGKEGRAGRLSFIKAIPLTKLQEIRCRVFGISWKPLHLPPDTSVQRTPQNINSVDDCLLFHRENIFIHHHNLSEHPCTQACLFLSFTHGK